MSARCGKSIDYCVFWYSITPHGSKGVIPSSKLISYEWRNPVLEVEVNSEIHVGQESNKHAYSVSNKVWVKPHGARCTSLWNPGVVTKVNSEHNVEVDGVPRHVCEMRRRWADEGERYDKSLISANLPTVGPNFVSSSSESNFERDAERPNATLENGNDRHRRLSWPDGRCFLAAWAMSKSVHCCLNDRPKPNLPKRKGIHPLRCSVWVCWSANVASTLPTSSEDPLFFS